MLFALLSIIDDEDRRKEFERVYRKYYLYVYNLATRIVGSDTEGEDVASQVWYEVATRINELDLSNERGIKAYVYIMTLSRASDTIKKKKPDLSLDEISGSIPSTDPAPDVCAMMGEAFDVINKAISKLNARDRYILTLNVNMKMNPNKISKVMNIPKNKVYKSIRRSRELIKTAIKEAKLI